MQSRGARVAVALSAIVAAVFLFLVLRDDGGDERAPTTTAAQKPAGGSTGKGDAADRPQPKPEVPTVEIVGGEPKGGPLALRVEGGDEVRFRVESDTPGEVHVHGYEIYKEVEPGSAAGISFPAEIEGAFEVEMHRFTDEGHVEIVALEVVPS